MTERVGFYRSPIGMLKLTLQEQRQLKRVEWCEEVSFQPLSERGVFREIGAQLDAYFAGSLRQFSLPVFWEGSEFYQQVWRCLCTIPYGETRTYQQMAIQCGHPKAARAVGQAVHRNPIPIILPCHRVIGASGALVGYTGGCEKKRFLLRLEGALT